MFLILLSIVLIGLYFFFSGRTQHPNLQRIAKYLRTAALILFIIGFFTSCFVQIDAGYVGVQSLFGKIQNQVLYPGLHFINPLAEVRHIDIKTQNYTMSGLNDEGQKLGDDAIQALTKDGLQVTMDVTVLYRVLPESAPKILNEIGKEYQDKIIRPITRTKIRDFCVYYEAVELYSAKRDEFQQRIFKSIETDFNTRGLIMEQLLVRNISLPLTVREAIEEKIRAEQDAQKMQFVLQKEKQEAERKRVEAQGIADYQKIINTGLTSQQLQYELIKAYKELAISSNAKVVIMDGKSVPFMINTQ